MLLTIRQTFPGGDPPLLVERGDTVALNPAAVEVDAHTLEQLLKTGTTGALEQAASLYRGELLEGIAALRRACPHRIHRRDAGEFDRGVVDRRRRNISV